MIIVHSMHYLIEYFATVAFLEALPEIEGMGLLLYNCIQHVAFASFKHQVELPTGVNGVVQLHDARVAAGHGRRPD